MECRKCWQCYCSQCGQFYYACEKDECPKGHRCRIVMVEEDCA